MPDEPVRAPHVRSARDRLKARLFDDEIVNLREQFYLTLRASCARVQANGVTPTLAAALARINELLAPGRRQRWGDCYEVEQLLVQLFDEVTLNTELQSRLLETQTSLSPRHCEYYRNEARAAGASVDRRRALLARLVNDIQWRYTVAEGKRRFSKSLTTRSSIAFLIALSLFGLLVAVAYVNHWVFAVGDLRLFAAAAVAGTWGATFSMLTGLSDRIANSRIYDLNVSRSITMVAARALVGAGAACVLFLFFCSGILSGKVFPNIAGEANAPLAPATVALLIIWCFIAGFSEKLVPSLLASTEGSAQSRPSDSQVTEPSTSRERPSEPAATAPGKAEDGRSASVPQPAE